MEGGAVDFNGAGTVLTTTSCLLNKNRNRGLSKARIEQYLRDYYGQKHVIWLGEGIEGDDTDGHIDDLARFIDERTIAIGDRDEQARSELRDPAEGPPRARQGPRSGRHVRSTSSSCRCQSRSSYDGQRVPATYVNFYFANGALLVPTFGQPRSRSKGDRDPAEAPAEARSDRRRLPQADLGPRRDSLLHPAATALLIRRFRSQISDLRSIDDLRLADRLRRQRSDSISSDRSLTVCNQICNLAI